MLRDPEDLALVLTNQLLKCGSIPFFRARYKRYVGVYFFRDWRLDGGHEQNGANNTLKSSA
jgi:hypothetical protein